MADNQTPKRPHYFKSQFLELRDFEDEQTYHLEMLRRHNRGLHGWGVVRDGLQVRTSATGLLITPGTAIDRWGQEIVLDAASVLLFQNNDQQLRWNADAEVLAYELSSQQISAAAAVTGNPVDVYITITFQESKSADPQDQYPPPDGKVDVTRWQQTPLLKVERNPPDDGSSIKLARVNVAASGTFSFPDTSVRPLPGCLGPLSLTSPEGRPQFGIDYDAQTDAFRIRARTTDAPALNATHLAIKRDTGNVSIENELRVAARLKCSDIKFRKDDINHGISYYGEGNKDVGDFAIDGPVVYGYHGGALGISLGLDKDSKVIGGVSLRWDGVGNVGIGTTNPQDKLQIGDGWNAVGIGPTPDTPNNPTLYNADYGTAYLGFNAVRTDKGWHRGKDAGGKDGERNNGASIIYSTIKGTLCFVTLESPGAEYVSASDITSRKRMVIDYRGNVGIGTANPGASNKLEVAGKVKATSFEGALDASNITGKLSADKIEGQLSQWNTGQGNISYSAGNVGIGTTSPNHTLDVSGPSKKHPGRVATPEGYLKFGPVNDEWCHIETDRPKFWFNTGVTVNTGNIGSYGEGDLTFFTGDYNRLTIKHDTGNVGIGTPDPAQAKLVVKGSVRGTIRPYGFLSRWETGKEYSADEGSKDKYYSIYADQRIAADEFNAFSDQRIKNIQGRSDSAADLRTLLGIEIIDYRHKDVIGKGNGTYKKVIGQQVEKVFPQVVSRHTDVVPDIYQPAPIRDGWVALATDLKAGERVRLISDEAEGVYEVLEVAEDKFRVNFKHEEDRVFVFGREVNDFRNVDYDAISMLNVSATQQLKKEKDEDVQALRAEIAELKATKDALKERLQLLESSMKALPNLAAATRGSNGNGSYN